jgi:hypothetical protein
MHRQNYFFFSCSTHFQGNHHTAGNSARRPHNSEPDPPKILIVSDWTTTPTTRAGSRQSRPFWPGNGRIASIPVVLAGEQLDPFHPGRSVLERPGSSCFGWRTRSPVRPDLAMARGFGPFCSEHMMKGIFVFV